MQTCLTMRSATGLHLILRFFRSGTTDAFAIILSKTRQKSPRGARSPTIRHDCFIRNVHQILQTGQTAKKTGVWLKYQKNQCRYLICSGSEQAPTHTTRQRRLLVTDLRVARPFRNFRKLAFSRLKRVKRVVAKKFSFVIFPLFVKKEGQDGRKNNVIGNSPYSPEGSPSESAYRRGRFATTARKSNSTNERLSNATPERLVYQNFSLASKQRR